MSPLFEGPARRRAPRVLDDAVEQFRRVGYETVTRLGPLEVRLQGQARMPICLRLVPEGRVFGGTYGLEVSTARPVLSRTRGLSGRGRGTVRMRGVTFRARRGDAAGRALAARLNADRGLADRLSRLHFERIRVEPDGRPAIRHMGGSLVWILFPPLLKSIPLVSEQAVATIDALEAFAGIEASGAG